MDEVSGDSFYGDLSRSSAGGTDQRPGPSTAKRFRYDDSGASSSSFGLDDKSKLLNSSLETPMAINANQSLLLQSTYRWTIENFKHRPEKIGEPINSPLVPVGRTKWRFSVYPRGMSQEQRSHVAVKCTLVDSPDAETVRAKLRAVILRAKGLETKIQFCFDDRKFRINDYVCEPEFLDITELQQNKKHMLPYESLTFSTVLTVVVDTCSGSGELFHPLQSTLSEDMKHLFENPEFSDCVLQVNSRDFLVHKAVLAQRSEVFRAMFAYSDMRESRDGRVTITDVDADVMHELLRFAYTGYRPNFDRCDELLAAADKYGMAQLKDICEKTLCANITLENCCQALLLGDLHNAHELKARATDFISDKGIQVMETPDWDNITHNHTHLLADVCKALAKRKASH